MKDLQLFQSEQFGQMNTINIDGEPWFVAANVCAALDLTDTSKTVSLLDDDEKLTRTVFASGQNREMLFISEPGLYSLVLRSRKPEAKAFKRWITHEVIPAIRRTGGYLAAPADATPEEIMARAVLVAQDTIKRIEAKAASLEAKVEADRPKVIFADAVTASPGCILIRELAKYLNQNGVDIGQNRLFNWLRINGYLIKAQAGDQNQPTQKAMDLGLFEVKKMTFLGSDGRGIPKITVKVTGKGQIYFVNKFLGGQKPSA